ncbi:MAG: hypoxanthine phosphoribosyltransferase [Clostridia bacterium]|nr:hypoxanthine phosphoribosyltransferase [Clostridia bacterium]
MNQDIAKVLLSEDEISEIINRLSSEVTKDYKNKNLCLLCVLKGSLIFCADLMRRLDFPVELICISASSYKNATVSSGNVEINSLTDNITGKDVLIIEDILDTGNTLSNLIKYLKELSPASVEICTILDKPSRRVKDISAKYVGSVIPDEFVVGYGLDYNQRYRNLPYIGILKPEIYNN